MKKRPNSIRLGLVECLRFVHSSMPNPSRYCPRIFSFIFGFDSIHCISPIPPFRNGYQNFVLCLAGWKKQKFYPPLPVCVSQSVNQSNSVKSGHVNYSFAVRRIEFLLGHQIGKIIIDFWSVFFTEVFHFGPNICLFLLFSIMLRSKLNFSQFETAHCSSRCHLPTILRSNVQLEVEFIFNFIAHLILFIIYVLLPEIRLIFVKLNSIFNHWKEKYYSGTGFTFISQCIAIQWKNGDFWPQFCNFSFAKWHRLTMFWN